MKTKNEVKVLSAEELSVLDNSYPVQEEENRLSLPKFGMLSKDITEESGAGKNKKITVIEAAGTFYTEIDLGETDEKTGKKVWTKEFIGEDAEVIIAFERKQLRKYDKGLEKFISSNVYDNKEQVISLFLDKQVIKKGTPDFLQSCYPALTAKGKPTSDLKEETILFVLYKGEPYQFTLSQSSKYEFKGYKKGLNPSTVLTLVKGSEDRTAGSNTYKATIFKNVRNITAEELELVQEFQGTLKEKVESDAAYFLQNSDTKAIEAKQDEELDKYGNEKMK